MRFSWAFPLAVFSLSPAFAAEPAPYCIGVRGNGENAPAHWAALARLVEENGMPKGMAGSSSGSVAMFFMDSLAGNPLVANERDPEKKRKMQALLLKSIPQFTATMAKTDKVANAWELGKQLGNSDSTLTQKVTKLLKGDGPITAGELKQLYGKYGNLVNPEMLRGVEHKYYFFKNEALDSLKVFGKFDAVGDEKLFFRPGVVDFKAFSLVLGDIADFYAGNTDDDTKTRLAQFATDCAESSYRKQWKDVPEQDCNQKFQQIVADYLNKGKFQRKALFQSVGTNIPSYPSTALVSGEGLKNYQDAKAAYNEGQSREYAAFSVDFKKDLNFGYWGPSDRLAQIDRGLEKYREQGDLKSQKFKAIGPANWFEVVSVSPAEPGLTNLQRMPRETNRESVLLESQKSFGQRWSGLVYRDDVISAGGWSDLHPTLVLKASGCENVVYLTRQGGDAKFGQQVFIRLAGETGQIPFWGDIQKNNAKGWKVDGTPAADTAWNKIYNLGNRQSSFQRSLREADAVYCTDWDNYNMFQEQMWPMVEQSYSSPVFLKRGAPPGLQVNPADRWADHRTFPGCVPRPEPREAESAPEGGEAPAL